jgi:pyruvate dehydrogenase (quinone)
VNISEHIVDRLRRWGVHRVYGYPGDGIGGVLVAVSERDDVQFVQVRHEETAGFAATAEVKFGGSPIGCCIVTSGPGALHVLNGLYDAKLDKTAKAEFTGDPAFFGIVVEGLRETVGATWRARTHRAGSSD